MRVFTTDHIPTFFDVCIPTRGARELLQELRQAHLPFSPFLTRIEALRNMRHQRARAIALERYLRGDGCGKPACPACNPPPEMSAADRAHLRWKMHPELQQSGELV